MKGGDGIWVKLATLDVLSPGGEPQLFKVVAGRQDAWTRHPTAEIGSVFLFRTGEAPSDVVAFNSSCPHLGATVEYRPKGDYFHCPYHDSTFAKNGEISDPKSPSSRGMDPLEVKVENGDEVWVKFQNFRANVKERVAVS